jgi:hypothetical protein
MSLGALSMLSMLCVHSLPGLQNVPPSGPAAGAVVAAADSSAHSATTSTHDLFGRLGWYTYAPDSGQTPIIERAIDSGVAHMFPLVRGIARDRLKGTNRLPRILLLVITPDSVGTQLDANKPMILSRTGATVQWDDGMGDVCRARETVVADTLIQLCAADRGSSITRYVLQDSGEVLRRAVHITSPHLSGPVDYVTLYRRCSTQAGLEPQAGQPLRQTQVVAEETPERNGSDLRDLDP